VAARHWLQAQIHPVALVTTTRDRLALRRLIEFEFPSVPVLSADEVIHPDRIVPADESLMHTAES
jgi:flagellar biosynthesis component FlhA